MFKIINYNLIRKGFKFSQDGELKIYELEFNNNGYRFVYARGDWLYRRNNKFYHLSKWQALLISFLLPNANLTRMDILNFITKVFVWAFLITFLFALVKSYQLEGIDGVIKFLRSF